MEIFSKSRQNYLTEKQLRICKAKGKRKTTVFLEHCPAASFRSTRGGLAARPREGAWGLLLWGSKLSERCSPTLCRPGSGLSLHTVAVCKLCLPEQCSEWPAQPWGGGGQGQIEAGEWYHQVWEETSGFPGCWKPGLSWDQPQPSDWGIGTPLSYPVFFWVTGRRLSTMGCRTGKVH